MRNLTMPLGEPDENGVRTKYKFRTLTRRQLKAVQKEAKAWEKDSRRLREKIDAEEDLTAEEEDIFNDILEKQEGQMMKMIRLSISANHKEFAYTDDPEKDEEIDDKLSDLVDIRDIKILGSFVATGTLPKQEEEVVPENFGDIEIG